VSHSIGNIMFDFGMWEIAIIFVITLIVVGPEKMPALARKAGLYVGKFRKFVSKIKTDINDELEAEDLKEQLSIENEELVLSQTLEEAKSSIDEIKDEASKISNLSSNANKS
ncbi:MAG: Sec-independent protein translocase protein TatB, partial [Candidatus Marinimicrobia bacterium]|nr:Sec-independent protein translocase protein TatB [Candidatus Neomarinimicrobiota bacterium]